MNQSAIGSAPRTPLARPVRVDVVDELPQTATAAPVDTPAKDIAEGKSPTHLSREQILDATAGCLEELGYDGTTIRRIAKSLDCAVGSIYRYFVDKRALLTAVTQRRFDPVAERIAAGASIGAVADTYLLIASEQPELYRLMFWLSSVGQNTSSAAAVPDIVSAIIDSWEQQLGDRSAAETLWSRVHGAAILGRDHLSGFNFDRETDADPAIVNGDTPIQAGQPAVQRDDLTLL